MMRMLVLGNWGEMAGRKKKKFPFRHGRRGNFLCKCSAESVGRHEFVKESDVVF